MKHTILFMIIYVLLNHHNITAQHKSHQIDLEIDPATFVLNGYSIHVRYSAPQWDHLSIGLGGYAMDMPDVLVNFNPKNQRKNWDVRLNKGLGVFAEYHVNKINDGFFIGSQFGWQAYKIEKNQFHESYNTLLVMAHGGYVLPMFDRFYLKPWAGIGYVSKLSGQTIVDDTTYSVAPITGFATLHIGYRF